MAALASPMYVRFREVGIYLLVSSMITILFIQYTKATEAAFIRGYKEIRVLEFSRNFSKDFTVLFQ